MLRCRDWLQADFLRWLVAWVVDTSCHCDDEAKLRKRKLMSSPPRPEATLRGTARLRVQDVGRF